MKKETNNREEVSIFTYKQPSLDYLPPLGQKIKNTSTDSQGRYELRIPSGGRV
jgi:hypothetical protein